jgi:hypothetical protein
MLVSAMKFYILQALKAVIGTYVFLTVIKGIPSKSILFCFFKTVRKNQPLLKQGSVVNVHICPVNKASKIIYLAGKYNSSSPARPYVNKQAEY